MHGTEPSTDTTKSCRSPIARGGFTLLELVVTVAVLAMLFALMLPTLGASRTESRLAGSVSNLRQISQASASYSNLHSGFMPGYSFEGRVWFDQHGLQTSRYDIGGGETAIARNNLEGAQIQMAAILRKATGRYSDHPFPIRVNFDRVPHRRYLLLPLMEWLGGDQPDPLAVSPLDIHQQAFMADPTSYELLPGGDPDSIETPDGNWSNLQVVNRWPFASSYQSTIYAWSPSHPEIGCGMPILPSSEDSHLIIIRNSNAFRQQLASTVAYPSMKAFFFEEFDYSQGLGTAGRYYAHPDASVNVLFFDGSARPVATVDANPAWDPSAVHDMSRTAEFNYRSIDTRYFPSQNDFLDDNGDLMKFAGYYKWTRGGLQGIDAGAGEIDTTDWCAP